MRANVLFLVLLFSCSSESENAFDWERNGVKIEKGKVIAYFPKDSVNNSRMNEIVDSLNNGIASAIHYINGPYEWQEFGERAITYYFEPGKFVSVTAVNGDFYIPLYRIKNYQAPWMHETMHALLRTEQGNWNEFSKVRRYFFMPIWFTEGLAEYLAIKLEEVDSIKKFDGMQFGGYEKVDFSCHKMISQNSNLISHIGESGIPTKLLTNRKEFAPPFYTCSCSFTKFLVETYGLHKMLKAASAFTDEETTIESITGKKLETLKEDWVSYLNDKLKGELPGELSTNTKVND